MSSNKNYFEIHRLQNLTTELSLLPQNGGPLEAVEFDQREVSFEAPRKTCMPGLLVELSGVLYYQNQSQDFSATGRVSGALKVDDQLSMFTIEMHRFDANLWSDFRNAIEQTQRDVDKLFRSMRDID